MRLRTLRVESMRCRLRLHSISSVMPTTLWSMEPLPIQRLRREMRSAQPVSRRIKGTEMRRHIFTEEHHAFRATFRQFLEKEVIPESPTWEAAGAPPRDFYRRAGELGFIGVQVPEHFGGGGA